jgi:hypothetical protein
MPLFGTLDLVRAGASLPQVDDLDTEAWPLPRAETLQVIYEVPRETTALLPPALHPALPSYVTFGFTRYPESPVGAFNLATVRLGSRAGAHPRGLVLGAIASTEAAAGALRARWGLSTVAGDVSLVRRHDRITGLASRDGRVVLECGLIDPEPISGADVQFINWVTLALAPLAGSNGGSTGPLLIQVDPRHTIHKAERGRPEIGRFDAEAWTAPGVRAVHPVVATASLSDTDLPRIRFVMDPSVPVIHGTRRIRESREGE